MALCVTAQVDLKVAWQQRMCVQSLFQLDDKTANNNKASDGRLGCQAAWDSVYWLGFAGVMAWINNHIHSFMTNVFTHPCSKFNGGKARPTLKVCRIIYGWPLITIFVTSDSAMISRKSLPNTSDKEALFMVTHTLAYFLHTIWCSKHTNLLKTIIDRSSRHCHHSIT